ncbi:Protein phosphatase 1 regulatory subunit 12B [Taenia crassiceps]|uniref:Protein phosphatase 1 regulatory subunit 12B n=1 Tax=Taenia crassiceps TaxID=6207 RepID=A0ABR4Q0A7_9CEST
MLACSALNTASRRQQIESWEASEMNKEVVTPRSADRVNFPIDVQFHAACKNSELDEVQKLLSKGVDVDVANVDGLTVLHQACIDNNYEVVQFLLSNNANVNAQDNEGWTPLHACASCSYTELAKLLLENGADAGIVSFEQELPLDVAQGGDMVSLLKDWMQRQSIDEKAARGAEEQQMLNDVQEWLKSGQYPRVVDPRTGATALHIAAAKGYSEVLELLLKLPDVEVDATDIDGWTPLHAAAHWAKEKPLRLLAAAGASFDIITLTNQSIYDVADRSVTMLLRQLRIERQRTAAAAEEKPVVTPPTVATRRKADDEEREVSKSMKMEEEDEGEKHKAEGDVKLAAPKVPKTTQDKEEKAEGEEEEVEEEKQKAALPKVQKDEIAMKIEKEEEEKKVRERLLERKEEAAKSPSPSPSPPAVATPVKEEEKAKTLEQPKTPAKEVEKDSENLVAPSPTSPQPQAPDVAGVSSVKTLQLINQNSLVSETMVTLDTTSMPTGSGPSRSSRHGRKDSTSIKRISAVLAPARSEETEAQRSIKARQVRSTRRSTQGIANDVLEEAKRLSVAGASTPASSTPTAAVAAVVSPTPVQSARKAPICSDLDDVEQKPTSLSATTHVSKATITPTQSSSATTTAPAADATPSSIMTHTRARRAARDRVPTGRLNTNDVLAAAKQVEQNASTDKTTVAATTTTTIADPIPRPTTRVLRSTILNTTPTTTTSDAVSNGGGGDRRISPATSQFSLSTSSASNSSVGKLGDQRYNWRENLDYRLLYEEERSEKERLKRTLDQVSREVAALRSELARLHVSNSTSSTAFTGNRHGSSAPSTDTSPAALQRRSVDFFEDQAKEIDRLRQENARMADENKSLIRVISKLSARTTS